MPSVFEELGRLCPDQHRLLVLVEEPRAGGVFVPAQSFVPLLEVQGFKLLARLPGHSFPGKPPELLILQAFERLDGLEELRRELGCGRSCGCNGIQKLGLKTAAAPLRALPKALVESFRKMKGDGMGWHNEDSLQDAILARDSCQYTPGNRRGSASCIMA